MKIVKVLEKKDGVALTTALVVGLMAGTYLSQAVNGFIRIFANHDVSYPVNDIVWPLVTILFVVLLVELLLRGLGAIKQLLGYTRACLAKNTANSLVLALALMFFLASQLSVIAEYLSRMILRLGDGNGAHPLGIKTNLVYPIVGIIGGFAIVELTNLALASAKKRR